MTQSSVCGPPMLKRKPKLFFSTFRISKNIIKNKNKLHTPHYSPVPSGRLPQLDSVVVRGLQIPLPAIPTGISLNLSLYLNQFVLIYNYLSITQLILFFLFIHLFFMLLPYKNFPLAQNFEFLELHQCEMSLSSIRSFVVPQNCIIPILQF